MRTGHAQQRVRCYDTCRVATVLRRRCPGETPVVKRPPARGCCTWTSRKGIGVFKLSDYLILGAAFLSLIMSVAIWFGALGPADREAGMFVGLWVPSILATGVYFAVRSGRR